MQAGLAKILNKIASDPANQMLVDRYIKLVKELKSEAKKSQYVLDLAEVLEESDPLLSMQYAYMVFQFNQFSTASLQIVVRCLKHLGRFAKAEILANEIRKIDGLKPRPPGFADSAAACGFSTEVSKVNVDGVDLFVSQQSSVFGKRSGQAPTFKIDALDVNAPRATVKLNADKRPPTQAASGPAKIEGPRPDQALGPTSPKSAPVPKVKDWSGPDLGVVLELFDFYFRQGLVDEAEDLLRGIQSEANEMPWWKARMAAITKKRGLLSPDERSQAAPTPPPPLTSPKHREGADESPDGGETLSPVLEGYLASGSYRRALHEVRAALAQKVALNEAERLYRIYKECCAELGLIAFKWREGDGLEALQMKVKQHPKRKLLVDARKNKKRKAS